MFRAAILRNVAASAVWTAARPATAAPVARLVARSAAVPSWTPKMTATLPWSAVRCYSAGGALTEEQVQGRIMSLLSGFDKVNDPAKITPAAHFANDLGLDSLDTVEVVMAIEEEFSIEIPDKDADQIHSVDKAVEYILHQPHAN